MENGTIYAYKLQHIDNPTFDDVQRLARNFIKDLPQPMVDEIYDDLNRGVDQLTTEPQMLVYLHSFGNMHQAKLNRAFEQLPDAFLQQPEIRIVDYGCGQAIGTMCYADFLASRHLSQKVRSVTLIEPSEICLKRAALHVSQFFTDAKIRTICKTFDDLTDDDLANTADIPTLHILSNVLDIQAFDLEDFANLIANNLNNYNQFVCVGPYFSYSNKDERMSRFAELLNGNVSYSKIFEKGELFDGKTWTAQIVCFSIGELEEELSTEVTEEEIKTSIIDDNRVFYSCDGKKLLTCDTDEYFEGQCDSEYIIKNGTQVICDNAFDGWCVLQRINIPDSVTSIGKTAFSCCERLQQITVPLGCTEKFKKILPKDLWGKLYISTNVTDEEIDLGIKDKFGVIYSPDGHLLLKCANKDIKEYVIREGTKIICDSAFYDCKSLQQINIPNTVICVGDYTFNRCVSLQQITIPNSVTNIGNDAFGVCSSLLQITIPNSVINVGKRAFESCISLNNISISNSMTNIGYMTFYNCKSLKHISIPNSVSNFGQAAFSNCESLEQITISNSITDIRYKTFEFCKSLKQVTIPNSVTRIDTDAFYGCESLLQITIPNSVTHIEDYAFCSCHLLQHISMSNSVTKIGNFAFSSCSSLQQITIPNSTRSIGTNPFVGCDKICIKSESKHYIVKDEMLISSSNYLITYFGNNESVLIPNTITKIGVYAFGHCLSLQQIIISNTVTKIEDEAFYYCSNLQQIIISNSVISIGEQAFYECSSLLYISIPNSVTIIDHKAFFFCRSLQQITIPESVTYIGRDAFFGCDSLQKIIIPEGTTEKFKRMLPKELWDKLYCLNKAE